MNHGYCRNCWWYKEITGKITTVGRNGIIEIPSEGRCYMHNSDEGNFKLIDGSSYCPDYTNRKKRICDMESVDDFIAKLDK